MFNQQVATMLAVAASTPSYQEYKARRLRQIKWTEETFPTISGEDARKLSEIIADLQVCRHCSKKICPKRVCKFNAVAQLEMFHGEVIPRYNDCRIMPPLMREHIVDVYKQVMDRDDWLISSKNQ